jgi:hypothetical protein
MATTMEPERPRAFEPGMAGTVGSRQQTPGWDLATERRLDDGQTLARQIGYFSVGLGVAELAAAGRIATYLGIPERTTILRLHGARELGKGVGILSQRRPSPAWLWARVAGDVLDLATLAPGLRRGNRRRTRVLGAVAFVLGATVLDVVCARQLAGGRVRRDSTPDRDRYGRPEDAGRSL